MKTKIAICNKCKKTFETEVDERGFKINTRCGFCKSKEKTLTIRKLNKLNIVKTKSLTK